MSPTRRADQRNKSCGQIFQPLIGPLTLSELAFASAPAHPILIDMMRRISSGDASESLSNALTDSVIQYLSVMTEGQVHWTDLREIPSEGLRFGDLLILSSQAFSMDVRSRIE